MEQRKFKTITLSYDALKFFYHQERDFVFRFIKFWAVEADTTFSGNNCGDIRFPTGAFSLTAIGVNQLGETNTKGITPREALIMGIDPLKTDQQPVEPIYDRSEYASYKAIDIDPAGDWKIFAIIELLPKDKGPGETKSLEQHDRKYKYKLSRM